MLGASNIQITKSLEAGHLFDEDEEPAQVPFLLYVDLKRPQGFKIEFTVFTRQQLIRRQLE